MKTRHTLNTKHLFTVVFSLMLTSCMVSYPATTFYVKNNSDKPINFKASVIKYSSMGQFEMTLPFTVLPNDSVLARKVGLRKDAEPTAWFTQFIIFPTDSLILNDPKNSANWIKSVDAKGRPVYTFILTK